MRMAVTSRDRPIPGPTSASAAAPPLRMTPQSGRRQVRWKDYGNSEPTGRMKAVLFMSAELPQAEACATRLEKVAQASACEFVPLSVDRFV